MSSTRKATDGEFHQERYCSAPEFELGAINGLAAAKRIAIIKDKTVREILWFVQWRATKEGGLRKLCDELITSFPERLRAAADWLVEHLRRCCLDPTANIAAEASFFHDLFGALKLSRQSWTQAARSRLADTAISREINETLDFSFSRRRMVLIEGVAGIGRTETAKVWRDAHAGLVRRVEVPASSDDRSFFASIARALGVARGTSMKAQEIKVRVEEMLATSELMLILDEAQYCFGQYMRPRRTPDRILWIKTAFDAGTPIALMALPDFSRYQAHFVKHTLWSDEQLVRRINRHVVLPSEHSRDDMIKIARAHLPQGETRSWKLLAAYALGADKKQASGIEEALESARYRAEKVGRSEANFGDIKAALEHDHGFFGASSGRFVKDQLNAGSFVTPGSRF